MRLELAGRDLEAGAAQPFGENLIKAIGLRARRCVGKGGSVSFAAVGVQGKLGNYQKFAADVSDRAIHFPLLVVENSQVLNLVREHVRVLFAVLPAEA